MHSQTPVLTQPIDETRTLIHASNLLWGLMWMWLAAMGLSQFAAGTVWGLWYVSAMVCAIIMVAGGVSGLMHRETILPRVALAMFAVSLVLDWIYALPEISNMSLLGCWTMILWVVNCDFRKSAEV